MALLYDRVTEPEIVEQIISMLDSGVPVRDRYKSYDFFRFLNGKFNPDLAFVLVQPLMNMVSAIGIRAGIEKLVIFSYLIRFISNIAELKAAREKMEQTSKDIAEDMPKEAGEQPQGLMAPPAETEEEELIIWQ